ncbi:protein S40-7-like [Vicia villosa]|uniref:protein S40-7-like n=1 Tax=Vicia villosa TaxID=3911 RepID=UPI00273C9D46|nr:protein S40-7-like [Vicia villosa]
MYSRNPTRFRSPKFLTSRAERFLGITNHAPPLDNSTPFEFSEDDVVFGHDEYNYHHENPSPLGPPDSSEIHAVSPENQDSPDAVDATDFLDLDSVSIFSSVSSDLSSSYATQPILVQQSATDRTRPFPSLAATKFYHSAPINIPIMSLEMAELARKFEEEEARELAEEEDFKNKMPPHEFLAKQLDFSRMHSCSLFEGVGRTLKGRDLRKVRNAVLSQTGFID